MRLNGKVALITGAASGIGASIAEQFAAEGARVVLADRNSEGVAAVAAQLRSQGHDATSTVVDVADEAQARRCVASAGCVDVLVNSAGIALLKSFLDTSLEEFDHVHRINVRGTFIMGQEVARSMLGRGGSIINIASSSGRRGNHGRSAYGCGKAAVIHLTQTMAVELAVHGIRVNVLAPGPIVTPLVSEAARSSWSSATPMGRYGRPGEVAAAALFLASGESSYVTGHCLDVDGGFFAGGILNH